MNLMKHIYSVLIVSSSEKLHQALIQLLPEDRFSPVCCVNSASKAGRFLLESQYDIVIINTPLPDDFGTRLALNTVANSTTGVLLLVKSELFPEINAQVSPYGVLAVSKPTSTQMILQSVQLLCSTRERLRIMEEKTASLEEKMQEIRVVNRAKLILIAHMKMTEAAAHRYIEKQAMDRCVTRKVVAETIIATYK